jgi:hypothetical protein
MIEFKDVPPRAQFEILRLYLQWRIRTASETRAVKEARGQERLSTRKVPQTELSALCGLSLGQINAIVLQKPGALKQKWPEILRYTGHDLATGTRAAFAWFTGHADAPGSARFERDHAEPGDFWADYDAGWLARQVRIARRPLTLSLLPEVVTSAVRILERGHRETREEIWLQLLVDLYGQDETDRPNALTLVSAALAHAKAHDEE